MANDKGVQLAHPATGGTLHLTDADAVRAHVNGGWIVTGGDYPPAAKAQAPAQSKKKDAADDGKAGDGA